MNAVASQQALISQMCLRNVVTAGQHSPADSRVYVCNDPPAHAYARVGLICSYRDDDVAQCDEADEFQ
jgi:hypothetical protein